MPEASDLKNDAILWNAFRSGSHQAFSTIYTRYFSNLFNYGRKFTQHENTIEECLQQLFVELWQSRKKLSSISQIKPYLYKSFRRKLLKNLKQHLATSQLDMFSEPFFAEISREREIIIAEQTQLKAEIIAEALARLSDRQREVIFLKFYEGMGYTEISAVMDCEAKVAYDLFFKGIQKLRTLIPNKESILLDFALFLYFSLNTAL